MNNVNPMFNSHSQYDNNAQFGQSTNGNPQDLSLAFGNLSNLNPSNLDYGQFSNASQLQQRFANDAIARHPSPGFQHPGGAYQTNPVVPAKRPRNDIASASPRPAPGLIGADQRSQTPQQPHNPYNNASNNYQRPPNAFPHMQNAAHNQASPSPAPSNLPFNPQLGPSQRHPTSSPHQFNAGGMNLNYNANQGQGASNSSAAHNGTPQPMRGLPGGQGYNQTPSGLAQMTSQYNGMQGQPNQMQNLAGQDAQYQQQQQYKMKLQQAQQQLLNNNVPGMNRQAMGNNFQNNGGMTPMAANLKQNGMVPGRQLPQSMPTGPNKMGMPNMPNMANMANAQQATEQNFLARLNAYAQQHNQSLDPQPTICGRSVNYYAIFAAVNRANVLSQGPAYNNWSLIASAIGFPPNEYPTAAREIEELFNQNLKSFATTYLAIMKKRMQMQQQQTGARPNMQMSPPSNSQSIDMQNSGSAVQSFQPALAQSHAQATPASRKASLPPSMNQPQQDSSNVMSNANLDLQNRRQPSLPRAQSITAENFPPSLSRKQSTSFAQTPSANTQRNDFYGIESSSGPMNIKKEDNKPRGSVHDPKVRVVESHGGLMVDQLMEISEELVKIKPSLPSFEEMGIIDINALSLSIQSGIHVEMRYALDQLLSLSSDPRFPLSLIDCEELVDSLIGCAEDQLDYLASEAVEESDEIQLPYVEDLAIAARQETLGIQNRPEFASTDYERQQAAERLIGITAILRNISFADSAANHNLLAGPPLIVLLSTIIRLLGTRSMLLYSHIIASNFMKDTVTLLSNIAHRVELPGKDEALSILHLLVAFAPAPPIDLQSSPDKVSFAFYDPNLHQYMPSAVDALAKLIARDEPNRTFIRAIFHAESSLPAASQLLTRAFSLSIAPLPDRNKGHLIGSMEFRLAEARKPFFCQGMLAADILASLLPSTGDASSPNLAQAWLASDDGWTQSLMHMVLALSMDPTINGAPMRHPNTQRIMDPEGRGFALVTRKALSMLQRLALRAGDEAVVSKASNGTSDMVFKLGGETIVQALCNPMLDPETLKRLLECAGMEEGL